MLLSGQPLSLPVARTGELPAGLSLADGRQKPPAKPIGDMREADDRVTFLGICLRHVILDHQYRSIGSLRIPTVEPEEIRNCIIIVVFLKAQAELSDAGPVDVA